MPINIDGIAPNYDATICVYPFYIKIDFAKLPSAEVLSDLKALTKNPGFNLFSAWGTGLDFNLTFPEGMDKFKIAEAIALCFKRDHGLSVLLPNPEKDREPETQKKEIREKFYQDYLKRRDEMRKRFKQ